MIDALPSSLPELLKPDTVAKALSVSRVFIYKLASEGVLPCVRIGAALRFDPADVAAFISQRRGARSLRRAAKRGAAQ